MMIRQMIDWEAFFLVCLAVFFRFWSVSVACELTAEDLLHLCWKFCLFHALQCILLTMQLFHSCFVVPWLGLFGMGVLMTFCPCQGVNHLPVKKRQRVKKAVNPEIALRKWILKVNSSYRSLFEARVIGLRRYQRLRCRTTPVPVWSPTKICFETGFAASCVAETELGVLQFPTVNAVLWHTP